ncbi:hypothetical protein HF324_00475 [Chitinophaga oryzae]|uniref:Uncharacterized protein n=1 Tax=Chitinophaga oryzae TaxID=2725414 RepID=A0ABX6L8U7_9BACT|nr:hypothetical protein [Chitinophaga oryzae]QJB36415.1 hypothetical protein HF324_00475 [Chitinophaga oryzae]
MARQLILENKGISAAEWFIPPFRIHEGELVVLNLKNPIYGPAVQDFFVDIITGKATHPAVAVHHPLTYVSPFRQSWFRRRFNPMSVATYLEKNVDPASEYAGKIYEHRDMCGANYRIRPHTKVHTLLGGPRKLLALCATLGRHRYIAYDIRAVGPESVYIIHDMVKKHVSGGGTALLIEYYDELRNDCSRYVEAEWDLEGITPASPQ